jgi:hypothetical protein
LSACSNFVSYGDEGRPFADLGADEFPQRLRGSGLDRQHAGLHRLRLHLGLGNDPPDLSIMGSAGAMSVKIICTCPATTSLSAGATPL